MTGTIQSQFDSALGTSQQRKMRDERSKEIGASASGILLREQSTPRHKDLEAGIWMRAVRRAKVLLNPTPSSDKRILFTITPERRTWLLTALNSSEE